jgi:hypothetical protein
VRGLPTAGLALLTALVLLGQASAADPARKPATYEERAGLLVTPITALPSDSPAIKELTPPAFPDAYAVWSSTGRDLGGRIWYGISANAPRMSAHLMQYDPESDTWKDRGAVLEQLRAAGLLRAGEGQIKIHSRMVTAEDGWIYFASTDEDGEAEDGSVPPRWGGHLWRIDPDSGTWQHLLTAAEGLVAVSGVGRYVYALGYWGHVLIQYDTTTGALKRTTVGSVGGHVSRNFLADVNGHAYVPRVTKAGNKVAAALVEYDAELREVAATPLEFYAGRNSIDQNHGIIGVAYLGDGRLAFTTHVGQLYLIEPRADGPAKVSAMGWFHPQAGTYAPSLFAVDGRRFLAGVTQRGRRFDWVTFDLQSKKSVAHPLDTKGLRDVLLYCSMARDNAGRFYLGGWASNGKGGQRPLLLQVTPAP